MAQGETGGGATPSGYEEHPELLPLPAEKRVYSSYTFWWMMFSMNTNIPMFFLGPIAYSLGLSVGQAALGAFLGNLAATFVLILNGYVGWKYGIPYPVQLRPAFGFRGIHIPVVLRGIVGAGWYGVEAYGGSLAITMIALYALGMPREEVVVEAYKYIVIALIFYVAMATYVMARGLRGIGKVATYGGPLLLLYFLWLLAFLAGQEVEVKLPQGVPYTSGEFATYLAVQTNWWATVALNISDLSRGLKTDKKTLYLGLIGGPLIGIVIAQVLGTLLGYYLVLYTEAIYGTGYVTPQDIIMVAAPGAVAIILGELFAFIAPFSTDVTANIPPLIDILTATLKLSLLGAAIGAGLIGFFLAPWWAVEKGPDYVGYVTAFSANYGVILGPIAGIMLADFYIIRRRRYDLNKLYTHGTQGYWYSNGISLSGLFSLILAIIASYLYSWARGQLQEVGPLVFPHQLSWYIGVIAGFIFYIILVHLFKETE
ncbi:MAG: cytosine permease [Desulfurococcales archaeon]|nr:cytosine permease [Desulfurococcales archaeon]